MYWLQDTILRIFLSTKVEVIYLLSLICFAKMNFSEQYHIKGEACDVICYEKSISSKTYEWNMFIKDLETWYHYNVILENSDIMLKSL
jgi:hypothetical protein